MEERQQREAQQAEERRKWEMEMERRDEYNRQHMEVLQSLVNGVHLQGETANRRADREKDVRMEKLTEDDDIVAYFTTFE